MSGFLSLGAPWAVEALIASTLLMLAVLVVREPIRRVFGARIAYPLWALPLLRLAMPRLPASWRPPAALPIERAGDTVTVLIVPGAPTAAVAAPSDLANMVAAIAVIWAIGAAAFLLHHGARHWRFCRSVMATAASIDQLEGVRVVTSAVAAGPLAFGVWRRTVAVPLDFAERYDADEQTLAIAHELGHHRRGDLIANWAALGVLAVHWFNPIAWRAFRAFRADQELANDATVLADRSTIERHVYACAIVKAAIGGSVSPTCHLHTVTDLKGRLRMLSLSPASRRRLASGAAVVAGLAVAGLGLTASGTSAHAIGAGLQQAAVEVAAPPAPPAPPVPPASDGAANVSTTVTARTAGANTVKRVVVTRDGKTTTYDGADVDAHLAAGDRVAIRPLARGSSRMIFKVADDPDTRIEVQDIPAVSSAECGIGTGEPTSMVVDSGKGGRRKIVICTDRIRQVTAAAMANVGNGRDMERNAYSEALAGLTSARASIVANTDMTDADRARALTAIDQSIVEMRGQLARMN